MVFIPRPGQVSDRSARVVLFCLAAIMLPVGAGLAGAGQTGRARVAGVLVGLAGLGLLWLWWRMLPAGSGRAVRLRRRGAVLALVSAGLLELAVALVFTTTEPGDPAGEYVPAIAASVAGLVCLVARIATGLQAHALPAPARNRPGTSTGPRPADRPTAGKRRRRGSRSR